jgi:hypothetical protein
MINTAITVCVITQRDARSARACLETLSWCEEVVVLDARDGDVTRAQKQAAMRAARHDWILFLHTDERMSPGLAREIRRRKLYGLDEFAAYQLPFVSTYLGHAMQHGDWWPDHRVRLFNRRRVVLDGAALQERVVPHGPVGRLAGHVLHDSYRDLDQQLDKLRRYASVMAEVIGENGRRASAARLLCEPAWRFLRAYILRGGYRDGWRGFAIAQIEANFAWEKQLRLYVGERSPRTASDCVRRRSSA